MSLRPRSTLTLVRPKGHQAVPNASTDLTGKVAVATTEAAERMAGRAVSEFGRLDIVVTNAGILRDKVLWKMSDEDFDAVITTHLKGTFTLAAAV